jgi:acetate kinase
MIFVVNAGSSSIKVALFGQGAQPVLSGAVTEIGGAARMTLGTDTAAVAAPDHDAHHHADAAATDADHRHRAAAAPDRAGDSRHHPHAAANAHAGPT